MNVKTFVVSLLMLSLSACATSQEPSHEHSQNDQQALGDISVTTLKQQYSQFFHHDNFQEEQPVVDKISAIKEPFTITTYFGTWCHDSKRELPRLLALLERADNPNISHKLIALDYQKTEPQGRAKAHGITNTPTFVISRLGQEIGRIKEKPNSTLGQDILEILQQ